MNNRRRMLIALGATATIKTNVFAQAKPKVWRIGVLHTRTRATLGETQRAFFEALRESGYVESRNISTHWYFAENSMERLPGLASQLVNDNVDLIVTQGTPAV